MALLHDQIYLFVSIVLMIIILFLIVLQSMTYNFYDGFKVKGI